MASIQERLQLKRVSLDEWSLKEQLCLASAVKCSGDQNWMSVSRSLKSILGNSNRPKDWFLSKNCAIQYGKLLDNVETPKRKKRTASERDSNTPSVETPVESLVRKLTQERVAELQKIIPEEQAQLIKLKEEIKFLESESMDEARIREMWAQIEQDRKQKERDQIAHQQWLKEREEKKAEMERIWRPGLYINVNANKSPSTPPAIKKEESDVEEIKTPQTPQQQGISTSSATSPLLTSLLKSSSPAPISSQTQSISQSSNARSAPTITTLLTGGTPHSHSVSSNPPQFPVNDHHSVIPASQQAPTLSMLLDKRPLASSSNQSIASVLGSGSISTGKVQETPPKEENPDKDLDDQQLMADLDDLMPDNIDDELVQILVDNNAIILDEDLLEEEEMLENVASLTADDLKIDLKDLKEETPEVVEPAVKIEEPVEVKPEIIPESPQVLEEAEDEPVEVNQEEPMEAEIPVPPTVQENKEPEEEINEPSPAPIPEEQIETIDSTDDNSSSANDVPEQKEEENVIVLEEEKDDSNPGSNSKPEDMETITELSDGEMEETSNQEAPEPPQKEDKKDEIIKIEITDSEDSNSGGSKQIPFEEKSNESAPVDVKEESEQKVDEDFVMEENSKDVEEKDEKSSDLVEKPAAAEITVPEKSGDSDDDMFLDAKESLDESGEKLAPKLENPVITAIKEEESCTKSTIDSDDDALIEVVKAKNKRDYSRKKQEVETTKKEENDPPTGRNLRGNKNRDRSESPMVEDDNSDTPLRTRRRYSSTLTDSSSVPNSPASNTDDKEYKAWKKSILIAFNRIYTHKSAGMFQKAMQEEQCPNHKNLIYRPMDLTTIKKNLESGAIRTTEHFTRDVMLMYANMMMYSKKNTALYRAAQDMMNESVKIIDSTMENPKASGTISSASSTSSRDNEKNVKRGNRKSLRVL